MKLNRTAMIIVVLAVASTVVAAQQGRGARNYDPSTETTVKGTVQEVQQYTGARSAGGAHLLLKSDAGTLDVHVGPTPYISQQGFSFSKGDQIEVTGSKVKMGGTEALIAREIKKDGKVLTLRDAQGIPKWSRGGRGQS